jgi:hypothetical protein
VCAVAKNGASWPILCEPSDADPSQRFADGNAVLAEILSRASRRICFKFGASKQLHVPSQDVKDCPATVMHE